MSPDDLCDPTIRVTGREPAEERITVEWPHGRGPCIVQPEIVEGWAELLNDAREDAQRRRVALKQVLLLLDTGALKWIRDDDETRTITARWREGAVR